MLDCAGVRDYIHVMDLAEGHLAALQKLADKPGCKIYNLGTGVGYSVLDMIKGLEKAAKKEVTLHAEALLRTLHEAGRRQTHRALPSEFLRGFRCLLTCCRLTRMLSVFFFQIPYRLVGRRAGDVATVYANPGLAEKELGWKAKRDLDKMCKLPGPVMF